MFDARHSCADLVIERVEPVEAAVHLGKARAHIVAQRVEVRI
jgi:hypothetical protein